MASEVTERETHNYAALSSIYWTLQTVWLTCHDVTHEAALLTLARSSIQSLHYSNIVKWVPTWVLTAPYTCGPQPPGCGPVLCHRPPLDQVAAGRADGRTFHYFQFIYYPRLKNILFWKVTRFSRLHPSVRDSLSHVQMLKLNTIVKWVQKMKTTPKARSAQ